MAFGGQQIDLGSPRGEGWSGTRGSVFVPFLPEFVEVEDCVFLRERYSPSQFQDLWKELGGDRSRIVGVINHVHLWDLFDLDEEGLPDEAIRDLAQVLASTWRCALQYRFPLRAFEVRAILDDPEEYGPTIAFSTVRQT